jgi:hypothetical protein
MTSEDSLRVLLVVMRDNRHDADGCLELPIALMFGVNVKVGRVSEKVGSGIEPRNEV